MRADETRRSELSGRTIALMLGLLALLSVVDLAIDSTYLNEGLFSLLVAVGSGTCVLVARRHLPWALPLLALGTVTLTYALAEPGLVDWLPFSARRLPVFTEPAAYAMLTLSCVRLLRPAGAVLSAAVTAVGLTAVAYRVDLALDSRLLLLMAAIGLSSSVGGGAYLRWLDTRREADAHLARQEERTALARELHDVVAHYMTGIVVQAQAAQMVLSSRPDAAADALAAIEDAGAEALRSMRSMVGTLRDERVAGPLAPTATVDDIRALAPPERPGDLPVMLHVDDDVAGLPGPIVASLHRIAMEAISNARRHARGATRVDVAIDVAPGAVTVRATDDGRPAEPSRSPGFGLVGITERVDALGGHLRVGPRRDGGWELLAELPTRELAS